MLADFSGDIIAERGAIAPSFAGALPCSMGQARIERIFLQLLCARREQTLLVLVRRPHMSIEEIEGALDRLRSYFGI